MATTYIVNNRHLIPNYGERYRHGEAIATGFVESTLNEVVSKRFCKKQQMQWSKEGAHLLLQTRVRTLNGELSAIFQRWYPDMDLQVEEMPCCGIIPRISLLSQARHQWVCGRKRENNEAPLDIPECYITKSWPEPTYLRRSQLQVQPGCRTTHAKNLCPLDSSATSFSTLRTP
jgi:hypothetical protein